MERLKKKLEQNEKPLLFSETTIPDIFFAEHLSQIPGDYLKIYLYMVFLSKYNKDIKLNDLSKNKYCKDNSINLLRIPYWDSDKIDIILSEYFQKTM